MYKFVCAHLSKSRSITRTCRKMSDINRCQTNSAHTSTNALIRDCGEETEEKNVIEDSKETVVRPLTCPAKIQHVAFSTNILKIKSNKLGQNPKLRESPKFYANIIIDPPVPSISKKYFHIYSISWLPKRFYTPYYRNMSKNELQNYREALEQIETIQRQRNSTTWKPKNLSANKMNVSASDIWLKQRKRQSSKTEITYPTHTIKHNLTLNPRYRIREGSAESKLKYLEKKFLMRKKMQMHHMKPLKYKSVIYPGEDQMLEEESDKKHKITVEKEKIKQSTETKAKQSPEIETKMDETFIRNHPTIKNASNEMKMKLKTKYVQLLLKPIKKSKTEEHNNEDAGIKADYNTKERKVNLSEQTKDINEREQVKMQDEEEIIQSHPVSLPSNQEQSDSFIHPKRIYIDTSNIYEIDKVCVVEKSAKSNSGTIDYKFDYPGVETDLPPSNLTHQESIDNKALEKANKSFTQLEKEIEKLSQIIKRFQELERKIDVSSRKLDEQREHEQTITNKIEQLTKQRDVFMRELKQLSPADRISSQIGSKHQNSDLNDNILVSKNKEQTKNNKVEDLKRSPEGIMYQAEKLKKIIETQNVNKVDELKDINKHNLGKTVESKDTSIVLNKPKILSDTINSKQNSQRRKTLSKKFYDHHKRTIKDLNQAASQQKRTVRKKIVMKSTHTITKEPLKIEENDIEIKEPRKNVKVRSKNLPLQIIKSDQTKVNPVKKLIKKSGSVHNNPEKDPEDDLDIVSGKNEAKTKNSIKTMGDQNNKSVPDKLKEAPKENECLSENIKKELDTFKIKMPSETESKKNEETHEKPTNKKLFEAIVVDQKEQDSKSITLQKNMIPNSNSPNITVLSEKLSDENAILKNSKLKMANLDQDTFVTKLVQLQIKKHWIQNQSINKNALQMEIERNRTLPTAAKITKMKSSENISESQRVHTRRKSRYFSEIDLNRECLRDKVKDKEQYSESASKMFKNNHVDLALKPSMKDHSEKALLVDIDHNTNDNILRENGDAINISIKEKIKNVEKVFKQMEEESKSSPSEIKCTIQYNSEKDHLTLNIPDAGKSLLVNKSPENPDTSNEKYRVSVSNALPNRKETELTINDINKAILQEYFTEKLLPGTLKTIYLPKKNLVVTQENLKKNNNNKMETGKVSDSANPINIIKSQKERPVITEEKCHKIYKVNQEITSHPKVLSCTRDQTHSKPNNVEGGVKGSGEGLTIASENIGVPLKFSAKTNKELAQKNIVQNKNVDISSRTENMKDKQSATLVVKTINQNVRIQKLEDVNLGNKIRIPPPQIPPKSDKKEKKEKPRGKNEIVLPPKIRGSDSQPPEIIPKEQDHLSNLSKNLEKDEINTNIQEKSENIVKSTLETKDTDFKSRTTDSLCVQNPSSTVQKQEQISPSNNEWKNVIKTLPVKHNKSKNENKEILNPEINGPSTKQDKDSSSLNAVRKRWSKEVYSEIWSNTVDQNGKMTHYSKPQTDDQVEKLNRQSRCLFKGSLREDKEQKKIRSHYEINKQSNLSKNDPVVEKEQQNKQESNSLKKKDAVMANVESAGRRPASSPPMKPRTASHSSHVKTGSLSRSRKKVEIETTIPTGTEKHQEHTLPSKPEVKKQNPLLVVKVNMSNLKNSLGEKSIKTTENKDPPSSSTKGHRSDSQKLVSETNSLKDKMGQPISNGKKAKTRCNNLKKEQNTTSGEKTGRRPTSCPPMKPRAANYCSGVTKTFDFSGGTKNTEKDNLILNESRKNKYPITPPNLKLKQDNPIQVVKFKLPNLEDHPDEESIKTVGNKFHSGNSIKSGPKQKRNDSHGENLLKPKSGLKKQNSIKSSNLKLKQENSDRVVKLTLPNLEDHPEEESIKTVGNKYSPDSYIKSNPNEKGKCAYGMNLLKDKSRRSVPTVEKQNSMKPPNLKLKQENPDQVVKFTLPNLEDHLEEESIKTVDNSIKSNSNEKENSTNGMNLLKDKSRQTVSTLERKKPLSNSDELKEENPELAEKKVLSGNSNKTIVSDKQNIASGKNLFKDKKGPPISTVKLSTISLETLDDKYSRRGSSIKFDKKKLRTFTTSKNIENRSRTAIFKILPESEIIILKKADYSSTKKEDDDKNTSNKAVADRTENENKRQDEMKENSDQQKVVEKFTSNDKQGTTSCHSTLKVTNLDDGEESDVGYVFRQQAHYENANLKAEIVTIYDKESSQKVRDEWKLKRFNRKLVPIGPKPIFSDFNDERFLKIKNRFFQSGLKKEQKIPKRKLGFNEDKKETPGKSDKEVREILIQEVQNIFGKSKTSTQILKNNQSSCKKEVLKSMSGSQPIIYEKSKNDTVVSKSNRKNETKEELIDKTTENLGNKTNLEDSKLFPNQPQNSKKQTTKSSNDKNNDKYFENVGKSYGKVETKTFEELKRETLFNKKLSNEEGLKLNEDTQIKNDENRNNEHSKTDTSMKGDNIKKGDTIMNHKIEKTQVTHNDIQNDSAERLRADTLADNVKKVEEVLIKSGFFRIDNKKDQNKSVDKSNVKKERSTIGNPEGSEQQQDQEKTSVNEVKKLRKKQMNEMKSKRIKEANTEKSKIKSKKNEIEELNSAANHLLKQKEQRRYEEMLKGHKRQNNYRKDAKVAAPSIGNADWGRPIKQETPSNELKSNHNEKLMSKGEYIKWRKEIASQKNEQGTLEPAKNPESKLNQDYIHFKVKKMASILIDNIRHKEYNNFEDKYKSNENVLISKEQIGNDESITSANKYVLELKTPSIEGLSLTKDNLLKSNIPRTFTIKSTENINTLHNKYNLEIKCVKAQNLIGLTQQNNDKTIQDITSHELKINKHKIIPSTNNYDVNLKCAKKEDYNLVSIDPSGSVQIGDNITHIVLKNEILKSQIEGMIKEKQQNKIKRRLDKEMETMRPEKIRSIISEKTKQTTPKSFCSKFVPPLKKLSEEVVKHFKIDEYGSTLEKPVGNDIKTVPKNNVTNKHGRKKNPKYAHLRISYITVKRPKNNQEKFLPALAKKRKFEGREISEERRKEIIKMRYEILKRLNEKFEQEHNANKTISKSDVIPYKFDNENVKVDKEPSENQNTTKIGKIRSLSMKPRIKIGFQYMRGVSGKSEKAKLSNTDKNDSSKNGKKNTGLKNNDGSKNNPGNSRKYSTMCDKSENAKDTDNTNCENVKDIEETADCVDENQECESENSEIKDEANIPDEEQDFDVVEAVPQAFECPSEELEDERKENLYYRYHQMSFNDLHTYLGGKRTFAKETSSNEKQETSSECNSDEVD